MKDQLQEIFDKYKTTFGQVLKSKCNAALYSWFMKESEHITKVDSLRGRAHIFLNNIDTRCPEGNIKPWNQGKLRFCNVSPICECSRKLNSEISKSTTIFATPAFKESQVARWKKDGNPLSWPENKKKREDAISARTKERQTEIKKAHKDQGYEQVILRLADHVTPLFTKDEYNGSFRKHEYKWKCVKCEREVLGHVDYGTVPRCHVCNPRATSKGERELATYIESLGFTDLIIRSTDYIPPQELDIVVPSKKVAFEYNGIYWHSTQHKQEHYHIDKFLECKRVGIHLIQIFENDWATKQDIVKQRISVILGKGERIYARNTTVSLISNAIAKKFIESHHLRGHAGATKSYGLHHDNRLVAVMSFGSQRFIGKGAKKKLDGKWELIRYCSDGQVVGGASKLLSAFKKDTHYVEIISYADRCWSNGDLYRRLGFTDVTTDIRNTGYWYTDGVNRYSRYGLTKNALVKLGYDSTKTEEEIVMTQLKYLKIFDCGNYVFKLTPPQ